MLPRHLSRMYSPSIGQQPQANPFNIPDNFSNSLPLVHYVHRPSPYGPFYTPCHSLLRQTSDVTYLISCSMCGRDRPRIQCVGAATIATRDFLTWNESKYEIF